MAAVCGTTVVGCSRRFVTAHTVTNRTGIFCAAQRRALGCGRFSRQNRFGWFNRSGFLPLPAFAFRLRHRRLSCPHRWLFVSTLLAFQRLPALHFLQTVRLSAVPLIVGRRNILTVAALSQTNSRETSRFPRRTRFVGVMFIEFLGKSCSHWIRPNGCPKPFGHFFERPCARPFRPPEAYLTPADVRQNSSSTASPRTAGISRSPGPHEGNSGK
jgi:hypothetical protein